MKPYLRAVETQVIPATVEILMKFSRKELREYAKSHGIRRGRNKRDTVKNLIDSRHASLLAQWGIIDVTDE